MSRQTSARQPRSSGRFGPADPGLADLQDMNENGTALHMDIDHLADWMDQVDRELDAIAGESAQIHRRERRLHALLDSLAAERQRLHERERRANRLLDQIRGEVRRLNEECLAMHRDAGRRGCELQAERTRAGFQVVIHRNAGRVEVRS